MAVYKLLLLPPYPDVKKFGLLSMVFLSQTKIGQKCYDVFARLGNFATEEAP